MDDYDHQVAGLNRDCKHGEWNSSDPNALICYACHVDTKTFGVCGYCHR